MYVAIEGVKGVGKTTLMAALVPHLTQILADEIYSIATLCPTKPLPKTDWLETQWARFQHDDQYLQCLYAARSNYHAKNTDWSSDLIISDRSIFTSMAVRWHHAKVADLSLTEHFWQIRQREYLIKIPDLVIQLDAPADILLARYSQRQRQYGRHEETEAVANQLKSNYYDVAQWISSKQTIQVLGKSIPWFRLSTHEQNISQLVDKVSQYITTHLHFTQCLV